MRPVATALLPLWRWGCWYGCGHCGYDPTAPGGHEARAGPQEGGTAAAVVLDRLIGGLASGLGSHGADVAGLLCIALGIVAGMGVYANAAGPIGPEPRHRHRHGRRVGPAARARRAGGARHRAGARHPRRRRRAGRRGPRSYLWVGGLMIAVGGCGLLHLLYGRPGLDAPTDELVDAGGLLGVAAAGPLAAGHRAMGRGPDPRARSCWPASWCSPGCRCAPRPRAPPPPPVPPAPRWSTRPSASAATSSPSAAARRPRTARRCSTRTPTTRIDLDARAPAEAAHLRRPPGPRKPKVQLPRARRAGADGRRPSSSRSSSGRR